ncbi:hypothetical protein [Xylella fastidiosa]|uniref:hypothetical protein n=1 Tax=Xylella fastidiosa TaxID=2371 RepID=UPI001E4E23F4|nr:hypothetical protein [Xylella fastidiosa]MDG5824933.1 hypothetical protein [Xylella fastidiosa subsp. pauca]
MPGTAVTATVRIGLRGSKDHFLSPRRTRCQGEDRDMMMSAQTHKKAPPGEAGVGIQVK